MSIFRRREPKEERASISGPIDIRDPKIWQSIMWPDMMATSSGIEITPESAMGLPTVLNAVTLIASSIGALPLPVYRRIETGGKELALEHPLYSLLHDSPNPFMIPMVLWEFVMTSLLLYGNAYVEIERDADMMEITGLWPLPANRVRPILRGRDLSEGLFYEVTRSKDGSKYPLWEYQVLHIPGLGFDGISGSSPIKMARESVSLGLAMEAFAGKFLANGARPGIALKMANTFEGLSEDARKSLKESFAELHGGLANAGRPLFLEEGMDIVALNGIPPADAQFIEQRNYGVEEVARIFNVPVHKLKLLIRATFSSIEMQNNEWFVDCLRPWMVRLEQSMSNQLFSAQEAGVYFAQFEMDAIMRSDSAARGAMYKDLWGIGALSPNEIRAKENLNPTDEGDKYYIPVNYMPIGQPAAPPAAQTPAPEVTPTVDSKPEAPERRSPSAQGAQRKAIRNSYRRVFEEAAARVARGERRNVMKAVRKYGEDRNGLNSWLIKYYRGDAGQNPSPHEAFIIKEMGGPFFSLAEAVTPSAVDQVRFAGDAEPKVQSAVKTHLDKYAWRQSTASYNRLSEMALGKRSTRENILQSTPAATDDEIDGQMEDWEGGRVDTQASWETVRVSEMAAKVVWALAGVISLVWVAGAGACEACSELDGTVVGIEQDFMRSDDSMELSDGSEFTTSWNCSSPPLHDKCECEIQPE